MDTFSGPEIQAEAERRGFLSDQMEPEGGGTPRALPGNSRRSAQGRPRVMVVDDDPVIGGVLAGVLIRGGYDVEVFQDSLGAMEAFDRLQPDLVVADWIMPGLDGLGLINALKRKAPALRTMLITGHGGDAETAQAARQDGLVDAVLLKPFDLSAFLEAVSTFLPGQGLASSDRLAGVVAHRTGAWKALTDRESYFEKILESIIDAVLMIDAQGRIIYHNRGAERMFGLSAADGDLPAFINLCPPESELFRGLSAFFKPQPPKAAHSEAFFQRPDEQVFYAGFSISPFVPAGRGPAVILVIKDINDRHLMEQRVTEENRDWERLAMTDPLTACYNRRYLDRRLDEEFKRMSRYRSPLTLIMIDFDHFKLVNDYFGHLVGDQVLSVAAKDMADSLRQVDVLARWGGEEFVALLPETGLETGQMVARRLHALIADSPKWADLTPGFKVRASLGLISLPWADRRASLSEVLEFLDRALYRAKEGGRNRIVRYVDTLDDFETLLPTDSIPLENQAG